MKAWAVAVGLAACLLMAGGRHALAGPPVPPAAAGNERPSQSDGLTPEEARAIAARGPRPARTTTNATEATSAELRDALAGVKTSPSADTLHRAAQAYLALGVKDQAFDHYAEAARREPGDAVAHDGMARIWRDWGWPAQALASAHRAVYFAPSSSTAWNTLGTVLERVDRPDEARGAYERSRSLAGDAWWADVNLCGLELANNRPEEAARHCGRVLYRHPEQPEANSLLREIESRRRSDQEAGSTGTGKTRP